MTSTTYPNDQPTLMFAYNTDQFTDPITGATIHDDGSPTYTDVKGNVWTKQRFINGWCAFNVSNDIVLVGGIVAVPDAYITEDGLTPYGTEDAADVYVQEGTVVGDGTYVAEDFITYYVTEDPTINSTFYVIEA